MPKIPSLDYLATGPNANPSTSAIVAQFTPPPVTPESQMATLIALQRQMIVLLTSINKRLGNPMVQNVFPKTVKQENTNTVIKTVERP